MKRLEPAIVGPVQLAHIEAHDSRLFPNQFLLGPGAVGGLLGWNVVAVREDLVLTAHPGLDTTQVSESFRSLTLVGFILDPDAPDLDNAAILQCLLSGFSSLDDLLRSTGRYGGRWVLIATCKEHAWLITDALALRQVFFTPGDGEQRVWVGSQPGILAECLGLQMSQAARDFIESYGFRTHAEYRWPAASTPYDELGHLLPNHYLDLGSGRTHRYWPNEAVAPVALNDAVDKLAHLLTGLVEAAARRFDLALGITAGLDSRLVLAASRSVKERISYITVRQGAMPDTASDVVIAGRLLARLGLSHNVIKALPFMSAQFSYLFKRNVCLAHDLYGADAEAILAWSQQTKVGMTGSGAEIGRCSFRAQLPDSDSRTITARDLAMLQKMDDSRFVTESFDTWLQGLGETRGVKVLDLFEWEQGHGNWLAMTQLEFDCALRDIFTPYNCRDVLSTMLAVDERHRSSPHYRLFRMTIERLWPDVLQEPINPPRPGKTLSARLAGRLRKEMRSLAAHGV